MAQVQLEASIVSEAHTESRLGRAFGLATAIRAPEPSPYIAGGPRPLGIDESKVTVTKSRS